MPNRRLTFAPKFTEDFKYLRKRYRRVEDDLRRFFDQLRQGETPGDQIPGVGYTVYKVRLRNSDAQRGKSGGYRILYYLKMSEHILLLTIYSKSEQSDIPINVIRRIIQDYEAS